MRGKIFHLWSEKKSCKVSNMFVFCFVANGAGNDLLKELWRLCAGPLMDVPCVQDRVFYFPHGSHWIGMIYTSLPCFWFCLWILFFSIFVLCMLSNLSLKGFSKCYIILIFFFSSCQNLQNKIWGRWRTRNLPNTVFRRTRYLNNKIFFSPIRRIITFIRRYLCRIQYFGFL